MRQSTWGILDDVPVPRKISSTAVEGSVVCVADGIGWMIKCAEMTYGFEKKVVNQEFHAQSEGWGLIKNC